MVINFPMLPNFFHLHLQCDASLLVVFFTVLLSMFENLLRLTCSCSLPRAAMLRVEAGLLPVEAL